MLQLFFLNRNVLTFRIHDRFIVNLQSMQYREIIYHLRSKNLHHVNDLMNMIDRKLRKLHDKRMQI